MSAHARGHTRPHAVATPPAPRGRPRPAGSLRALALRTLTLGLALVVLAAFAIGTYEQQIKGRQLREQVAAQQATLDAAAKRNADLRAQLAASDPDAYRAWVEDTARRQLNLGYPGETIYLVNWTDPLAAPAAAAPNVAPPAASATPTPDPNWKRWLRLLGGQ